MRGSMLFIVSTAEDPGANQEANHHYPTHSPVRANKQVRVVNPAR
jgi:hypothetical protein